MTTLGALCRRLQLLQKQIGVDENENEIGADDFTLTKKLCAELSKQIREGVAERDALLGTFSGPSAHSIEASARLRRNLKNLQEAHRRLEENVERDIQRRNKKATLLGASDRLSEEVIEQRKEISILVKNHVRECENLVFPKKEISSSRVAKVPLLSDISSGTELPTHLTLDSIDDDEIRAGKLMLQSRDKLIDEGVDEIGRGVANLKELALGMKSEIAAQEIIIAEIETEVDKATNRLIHLNTRVKAALDASGGASRIILNVILLVIFVALAAFLIKTVQGGGSPL